MYDVRCNKVPAFLTIIEINKLVSIHVSQFKVHYKDDGVQLKRRVNVNSAYVTERHSS